MPEATVVAKRFTLVKAAQAAEFLRRNFILLEAFCLTLQPDLMAAILASVATFDASDTI